MTETIANTQLGEVSNKFRHLWSLVGNTPMVAIEYRFKGKKRIIYAKCESFNLTGSIKDRMALLIMQEAYLGGDIQPGNHIVEATSGNTGIAFSAIGKALGHPVTIIMPDWLSRERKDIIKSFGANIIYVSKEEGGFIRSIELSREMAQNDPHVFLPRQFENAHNIKAHEVTTAYEIWHQLATCGLRPDAFVAGVGTGGTIMGAASYFKSLSADIAVHPLEPKESPTLTTGYKVGSHRIQGISDEFIPSIVQLNELDRIIQAADGDSIITAQKLTSQLGLAVGISSGANILGAIQLKEELGDDATVVTVLADSNKKYPSTDLVKEEPVKDGYLSSETEFVTYRAINCLPTEHNQTIHQL